MKRPAVLVVTRKTLRNNLLEHYPKIEGLPEATLRAEQLSLDQFIALFKHL